MSGTEPTGTDELFPGAEEHLAPEPSTDSGAGTRSSARRLGIVALVIAIVAFIGDVIGAGIGYTTLFVEGLSDDRLGEIVAGLAIVVVFVGLDLVLALLALALGIAAAVTHRGPRLGVIAAGAGCALVIVHVAAIAWFVSLSNALY